MMTSYSTQLDHLNTAQLEAVTTPFGNVLVLAGAGSGKTRVLVQRIAWFLQEKSISPSSILAVTFTNKAAQEMKNRLHSMLHQNMQDMWVGTFHGLSHQFLRRHWKEAGLPETFQVLDADDQQALIKRILKALEIDEDRFEPKKVQNFINRKKDEGLRAKDIQNNSGFYDQIMLNVYQEYEKLCQENGLVDFAELLLRMHEVLKSNPELLQHYQNRFTHFLIDEFQDTNTIQYTWMRTLARQAQSVTVVGDDDQSIYGWRGAKIGNIRRFEQDFSDVQVIRLEQNYRSTNTILDAANALIANNENRMGKTLWTEDTKGEPIQVYAAFNEEDEALYIVRQIRQWIEQGGALREIGILYRSNAQSRILEEALVRANIPYLIYGGLRFFERAEIKDVLAYIRLAVNTHDNLAYERSVNMPTRGIGSRSLDKIKEIAEQQGCSYWQATQYALQGGLFSGKTLNGFRQFSDIIAGIIESLDSNLTTIMQRTMENSGLLDFYREQDSEKSQLKAENLEELLNATHDFEVEELEKEQGNPLSAFLAYTALDSGEKKRENESAVQLMTLHSAKGLEFPFVFICGLEDGLFPHLFSRDLPESLEEERRLCYVGITRARQKLHLSYAEKRRLFGREENRVMSRFISEIPPHLLSEINRNVRSFAAKSIFSNSSSQAFSKPSLHRPAASFALGQRVQHPKFGAGIVLDFEGFGDKERVHIHFDREGSKWLALAFAKLEAV